MQTRSRVEPGSGEASSRNQPREPRKPAIVTNHPMRAADSRSPPRRRFAFECVRSSRTALGTRVSDRVALTEDPVDRRCWFNTRFAVVSTFRVEPGGAVIGWSPTPRTSPLNPGAQVAALRSGNPRSGDAFPDRGHFILGPDVVALEQEVAAACGAAHGIGVKSGSGRPDPRVAGSGHWTGDEVITSPFTYIAPAESIHQVGAKIVFADVHPRYFTLDPADVAPNLPGPVRSFRCICSTGGSAPGSRAIGLPLIEDCASHRSRVGRKPLGIGRDGLPELHPTKNLGARGDGAWCSPQDAALARTLRMLRVHGIERRYHHDPHGWNSRLDDLQAAIPRVKLPHLAAGNARRAAIAARYDAGSLARLARGNPLTAPGEPACVPCVCGAHRPAGRTPGAFGGERRSDLDLLSGAASPAALLCGPGMEGWRFSRRGSAQPPHSPLPMYPEPPMRRWTGSSRRSANSSKLTASDPRTFTGTGA